MKKIFSFTMMLFLSFFLCSCSSNDISIATSYSSIFKYDAKSYYFNNTSSLDDIEYYVTDTVYYSTEDISDTANDYDYILNISIDDVQYSFSLAGYLNNVYYLNDSLFILRYVDDYQGTLSTAMIVSRLIDDNIEDVYIVLNCNEGYSLLTFIDDYYYLYYFNNSSLNLCYAKLDFDLDDADDYEIDTQLIASCTNVINIIIINPLEFYFIDNISLYYFSDNGDGIFNSDELELVSNDVTYMYQDSDNNIYFYEVKCTRIVSNTNLTIAKYTISKDSSGNYDVDEDEIISNSYFLRFCDYYCYEDQIYIIFDDFLGIVQYDCTTGEIYSYYDDSVSISDSYGINDYLIFSIDSNSNTQNYYLLNLLS